MRLQRAITAVVVLLVASAGAGAQRRGLETSGLAATVASRALQPGELVVFTMRVDGAPSSVDVELFGRHASAFLLDDGRWRALVGIDLDQKPASYVATIEARLPSGTLRVTRTIVVKPKIFPTRTLTVSPDFVNPPESERVRIERDSAFLRGIFAASPPRRLWTRAFVPPVPDPANSRFGLEASSTESGGTRMEARTSRAHSGAQSKRRPEAASSEPESCSSQGTSSSSITASGCSRCLHISRGLT